MSRTRHSGILTLTFAAVLLAGSPASAQVDVQCPGDTNGDAKWGSYCAGNPGQSCTQNNQCNPPGPADYRPCVAETKPPNTQCMHLSGGDGFVTMADGKLQYIFGFSDLTGTAEVDAMAAGILAAAFPAPAIVVDQGKEFYLTLTNVGMLMRPDLFDPHTVHFHGFPQSSTVFDGLPESGISINMGASLTYYYNLVEPGTYMYHCHVEATEHMQMGMLGNLYVRAAQTGPLGTCGEGPCTKFAYNDGDGSTGYNVEAALQLGSFDPDFHDASMNVQPLPFANMWDRYPMINGRGYPDTIEPGPLTAPNENGGIQSQKESSLITATSGQKVLLRLSNLNITTHHTLSSPSIPMRVVAIDAKELVADDGIEKLHYTTNSVTLSGGMSADVILDTTGVPVGDYFLYAANLQFLANNDAPGLGGMMTKIVIN